MVTLQYNNGKEWVFAGEYPTDIIAWMALGPEYENHRTVDQEGKVINDKNPLL